ncbi:FAD-dependent monooxygenase [Legionella israelensis]|uniref:FAD-dependent monooxygenase n=1 Tax=Legionella israelensis TaxID=454 RepID=A0AAX1EGE8_9GAMM|nr:NAD(P)/FAD-dependent oxidoreductase [Legionella israelensis]QBR84149.1 FAD-dependent monooxygenase [Legionella israelensis]
MRILIVGAGIAGLSLTVLLRQRGLNPTLIEKSESFGSAGYMLGLYPTGANVLRSLNGYKSYLDVSVAGKGYEAYNDKSQLLKQFSFAPMIEGYGPYQLVTRYDLLDVIYQTCKDLRVRFNTQISSLTQTEHEVKVVFSDQSQADFDLVVGADGLHSQIRSFILKDNEYHYFHTGWGGWVWWDNNHVVPENTIQEFWGKGVFLGMYPVRGKTGMIAAVDSPSAETALKGRSRKEYIIERFSEICKSRPEVFAELPSDDQSVFFWPLSDQRATKWHKGRVVLLGDAATAFLPTAGIGATMALESAAVLNDILSRTGVEFVQQALDLFEKRRRTRVERAQNDSRRLAKLMFVSFSWGVWIRDFFTRMMSVKSLMKGIMKGFNEPI